MPSNSTIAKDIYAYAGSIESGSVLVVSMSHDHLSVLDMSDEFSEVKEAQDALSPLLAEINAKFAGQFYFFSFAQRFVLSDLVGLGDMISEDCPMPDFTRVFDGVVASLKESGYVHNVEFILDVLPSGHSCGSTLSVRSENVIAPDPEVLLAQQCFNQDHPVLADILKWYSVFTGTLYMRWDAKTQDYATPESHPVTPRP